ncbi:MAG: hypothetical protein AAF945_11940 [Actinomycetota bacterium]
MSRLIHPRPSRSWAVLVVGAAAVTWPACGGTSSGGDDAGLVERGLGEIPIEVIEAGRSGTAPVFVEVTDLSAVAEVRGLDAPAPGRDAGDVVRWMGDLTLAREPAPGEVLTVPLRPAPLFLDVVGAAEDLREAIGIDPGAIETLVSVTAQLSEFSVVAGPHEPAGGLVEVGGGVLTLGEGDDNEIAPDRSDDLRLLGRPWRVGAGDGSLAVSLSTPAIEAWLAGGETARDDDDLVDVARALDDRDVLSAFIVDGRFLESAALLAPDPFDDDGGPNPFDEPRIDESFDLVGMGPAVVDGDVRYVVAYLFDDAGEADDAVASVEAVWAGATSVVERTPISDIATVDSIEVDDRVVTLVVRDERGVGIAALLAGVTSGEAPFVYR